MSTGEAILSADAANDQRFDTSQSIADFRIRSMMCVPLRSSENESLGVIQIDTLNQRTRFTPQDLEVLAHVAILAATAIENAQLHELAINNQVLERDLELAHKVQQGILPSSPPRLEGYDFFDYYEPALQVGGDYFDYVRLPRERLGLIVADVSGKGVPAALVMARLSSEARYALASHSTPAAAMKHLNESLAQAEVDDRFVTMLLCILDLKSHVLRFTNAGHPPPRLRRRDGKVLVIGSAEAGFPLGVRVEYPYKDTSLELGAGESLTLFTDGFSEAMNTQQALYGLERIDRLLTQPARNASQLGQMIIDDVKQFVGTTPQSDDMCLLCFGRNSD
jgi:serine phosphatase RsbU (regulator of sigma subunit)